MSKSRLSSASTGRVRDYVALALTVPPKTTRGTRRATRSRFAFRETPPTKIQVAIEHPPSRRSGGLDERWNQGCAWACDFSFDRRRNPGRPIAQAGPAAEHPPTATVRPGVVDGSAG